MIAYLPFCTGRRLRRFVKASVEKRRPGAANDYRHLAKWKRIFEQRRFARRALT